MNPCMYLGSLAELRARSGANKEAGDDGGGVYEGMGVFRVIADQKSVAVKVR